MVTIKQWMELVDYRITEGSDYGWECYGPDSYILDSWNSGLDGNSFSIIFDTKTQEVYEVQSHDYKNQRAYRMVNPNFLKKMKKEAKRRDCNKNEAWDDVDYVDLEVEEDFLEKARAIEAGTDYDTRIVVPLDLLEELLLEAALNAHRQGITLNDYINNALAALVEEVNRDPEGVKARMSTWKEENDIAR